MVRLNKQAKNPFFSKKASRSSKKVGVSRSTLKEQISDEPNQKTETFPEWMNFSYIRAVDAKREITRRIAVVKSELIKEMLAVKGHIPSGNDIITYVNILTQQPILIFIYKEEEHSYIYRSHFDLYKTKISRGSLDLQQYANPDPIARNPAQERPNFDLSNLEKNKQNTKRLFNVYGTTFYFRCFLLDTNRDDQPFLEVTQHKESNLKEQYEYVRLCLMGLLQFDKTDIAQYGALFCKVISEAVEKTFENFIYIKPERGRSQITIADPADASEVTKLVHGDVDAVPINIGRLNKTYANAAYAAKTLKLLENGHSNLSDNKNTPNLFFMLRAYNRTRRRAVQITDGKSDFFGYSYNIRFEIPENQLLEITNCFEYLASIGSERYRTLNGADNELFGGYINSQKRQWDFGATRDKKKAAGYRNFAISLDEWFWCYLDKIHKCQNSNGKIKRVRRLVEILASPVGSDSTSLADPIFYYGASMFRMPFRRMGGLARLHGLEKVYEALSGQEQDKFRFEHLRNMATSERSELKFDCVRVVLFFYLSRFLAPYQRDQQRFDTKVHLYPLDVGGAVVGAVGKVSYDLKAQERSRQSESLPTTNQVWNQEMVFFTTIVSAVRASLRRQYRDLQIGHLTEKFRNELDALLKKAGSSNQIRRSELNTFAENLNKTSRIVARFCPYPEFKFEISSKSSDQLQSDSFIDFGNIKLLIQKNTDLPIFRALTPTTDTIFLDNRRILLFSLFEKAQQALNVQRSLNNSLTGVTS